MKESSNERCQFLIPITAKFYSKTIASSSAIRTMCSSIGNYQKKQNKAKNSEPRNHHSTSLFFFSPFSFKRLDKNTATHLFSCTHLSGAVVKGCNQNFIMFRHQRAALYELICKNGTRKRFPEDGTTFEMLDEEVTALSKSKKKQENTNL
jgi:hypothetical protein